MQLIQGFHVFPTFQQLVSKLPEWETSRESTNGVCIMIAASGVDETIYTKEPAYQRSVNESYLAKSHSHFIRFSWQICTIWIMTNKLWYQINILSLSWISYIEFILAVLEYMTFLIT